MPVACRIRGAVRQAEASASPLHNRAGSFALPTDYRFACLQALFLALRCVARLRQAVVSIPQLSVALPGVAAAAVGVVIVVHRALLLMMWHV